MLIVDDERFETYAEAAKHLGVSSGVLRQRFSEFNIKKNTRRSIPFIS